MEERDLLPGRVLVRNTNRGVDPEDRNYQLLYNEDDSRLVRCKRVFNNFGIVGKIFDYLPKNGIYYPILFFEEGDAYLLAPTMIENVVPGMAIPDLVIERDLDLSGRKNLFLSHSKNFHIVMKPNPKDEKVKPNHNCETEILAYKTVISSNGCKDINSESIVQGIVTGVRRNYSRKKVDTLAIKSIEDNCDIAKDNDRSLQFILDNDGKEFFWWDKISCELRASINSAVGPSRRAKFYPS